MTDGADETGNAAGTASGLIARPFSTELLKRFLLHAPTALAMFDEELRLVLASRSWFALLGLEGRLVNRRPLEELLPGLPASWRAACQHALSGMARSLKREAFQPPGGESRLLGGRLQPWFTEGGEIGGILMEVEPHGQGGEQGRVFTIANRMFRALCNQIPVMLFSLDRRNLISDVNRYWLEIMGYPFAETVGQPLGRFLSDSSRRYMERVCLPAFRAHGILKEEPIEFIRANGETVEVLLSATANRDSEGLITDAVIVATDVTESRRIEEKLRQTAAALRVLDQAVVLADRTGRITDINPAFSRLTGFSDDEVVGNSLFALLGGNELGTLGEALERGGRWEGASSLVHRGGKSLQAHVVLEQVREENGEIAYQVMSCAPASQPRPAGDGDELARQDQLTRLPNRHMLEARLEQLLGEAAERGDQVTVLCLDLDRFKTINEGFGHDVGDRILQAAARRLSSMVRADDIVARIGGDDFVIVLRHTRDAVHVEKFSHKLLDMLSDPLRLGDYEICLTACIGISRFPDDGASATALLRNAGAALHTAKESGSGGFHFYRPELTTRAHKRLSLDSALRRALRKQEFELFYQPQVAVDSGELRGVEALLRWRHPRSGLLLPQRFLEYAEETGLIVSIGEWVMQEACRQVRVFELAGFTHLRVAVNVSTRQLVEEDFVRVVHQAIAASGIDPGNLELEVTETVFLKHSERLMQMLHELKSLGITLTIDDFGAGYSSLGYLKNLPVDRLKIDRIFVRDLPDDHNDAAIARAIVSMCDSLSLEVVAEGVENEAQFACLKGMGCGLTQGYLFGQPMAAGALLGRYGMS